MDAEYLGRLLDEHAAALELYARQWCAAPEDVVQEAFLQLVRQTKLPTLVVPWLYRVVRNGAMSAARSAGRRRHHEAAVAIRDEAWFIGIDGARLDAQSATAALSALPIEERETIVAHLWGGLTFEQIAELTETSSSTAHRRYEAGLLVLRERLGAACPKTGVKRST